MSRLALTAATALATTAAAVAAAANVAAPPAPPAPPPSTATALTIYSSAAPGAISPEQFRQPGRGPVPGYAVVRQERPLDLTRGRNAVRFADVAALIDPTTVSFESLTDARGTTVLEQNYQFDLVSTEKLLQRYVDKPIAVEQVRGQTTETFSGTLLSTQGGLVLKRDDGSVQVLPHNSGVKLPALPGGLITRPTLVWDIAAKTAGMHRTRVGYQTQGMTWWADYNLTYADGERPGACRLDIAGWVSIVNQSGASYGDARLKLVAGDVHRAPVAGVIPAAPRMEKRVMSVEDAPAGFAQKAFFEYHLYTLGRTTTLPDNSTKQIELFPAARQVPCERLLVYAGGPGGYGGYSSTPVTDRDYGVPTRRKVDTYLNFANAEAAGLGMPLPAGRVRVSKLDPADQSLEFIGEDTIDHTPRNEKLLLKLGSAFDVVGERRQTEFRIDTARRTMSEEIEVRVRNQKKERVQVLVKENMYRWVNWTVSAKTHDYRKEDARTIVFPVTVAPEGETVVRYSVQYSW